MVQQDYPDWTDMVQLVGTDIMLAVDIQGAYIMMAVDIQAQYVTLDIDIVAQTVGNININIAAQSAGAINVDIAAQTVGIITIDIEAQSVGVYLQAEWAVKEGTDVSYSKEGSLAFNDTLEMTIDVAANDDLYISGASFYNSAVASGDADKPQMANMYLQDTYTPPTTLLYHGGNGGSPVVLNKPLHVPGGHTLKVVFTSKAGHNTGGGWTVWGYKT